MHIVLIVGALGAAWLLLSGGGGGGSATGGVPAGGALPAGATIDGKGNTVDVHGNILTCANGSAPSPWIGCAGITLPSSAPPAPPPFTSNPNLTQPTLQQLADNPEARTGRGHF